MKTLNHLLEVLDQISQEFQSKSMRIWGEIDDSTDPRTSQDWLYSLLKGYGELKTEQQRELVALAFTLGYVSGALSDARNG